MPQTPDYLYRDDLTNPAYEGAQEKTGGNPLTTLAGEFLKFGVAMWATKKIGGGVANAVFKGIAGQNRGLAQKILQGSGRASEELYANAGRITMGGLFRGVAHTMAQGPKLAKSDAGQKWIRAMSKASEATLAVGKTMKNVYTDAMASKYQGIRRTAKTAAAFAKALPAAASFYVVGRPLGMVGEKDDLPSWYNLPGHLGEITKLTGEFAAFDAATGGAKLAYKGLRRGVEAFAGKHLSANRNPALHNFMDKTFAALIKGGGAQPGSFLQTVMNAAGRIQQAHTFAKEAGRPFSQALGTLWGNKAQRAQNRSSLYDMTKKDFWFRTLDTAKSEAVSSYRSWTNLTSADRHNNPSDFLRFMETSLSHYYKHITPDEIRRNPSILPNKYTESSFRSLFSGEGGSFLDETHAYLDRVKKGVEDSFGSRVMKRQMATTDDILSQSDKKYASKLFAHLHGMAGKDAAVNKQISNLQSAFKTMYAGKGIYKSQSGVIDYTMYSPRNIYKSAIEFTNNLFTLPMGKGRDLPILEVLGFNTALAKQGLAIHPIGMDEQQYYQQNVQGGPPVWNHIAMTGNPKDDATHGLAGVFMDGKLFVTDGASSHLRKVDAPQMRMINIHPYSRYAQLHRIKADSAYREGQMIRDAGEMDLIENKTPGHGFLRHAAKFLDRMGIQTPSLINSIGRRVQDMFGIGPRTNIFRDMMDVMMNPNSQANPKDLSALLNNFIPMAEDASRNMFFTLSNPKILRKMAEMSKANIKGVDAGKNFEELAGFLERGGNDREFMNLLEKNYVAKDDHEYRYAMECFQQGNLNLRQPAAIGSHFNAMQLSRKHELMRTHIVDSMSDVLGMPSGSSGGVTFNLAKHMLDNPEIAGSFSRSELDALRILSARIELQGSKVIGRRMFDPAGVDPTVPWSKASDIITKHFKGQEQGLLSYIQKSSLAKGQTGFGLDDTWAQGEFDRASRGIRSDFGGHQSGQKSSWLLTNKTPDVMLGINSILDRVMGMSPWYGLRYGAKERADSFIHIPGNVPIISGSHEVGGPLKTIMKRVAQGVGFTAALQAADTFTDLCPLFQGTILDEGIFVGAAELGIKASMAFHKAKDVTGITEASKYLEGLMPSSTSTIPGAVAGAFMWGPLGIPVGAIANRFMSSFMLPDMDKSYDEMKDIYSGRELVPIRKGRWWLFSKSQWAGEKVQYYRPHWYPRLKSQYKYTSTLYGSKAEAFLHKPWAGVGYNPFWLLPGVDKYHYEKKHYYTRPYAETAPAFTEVPIIGKVLAGTLGRMPIVGKPVQRMHHEEMAHYFSMSGNTDREFGDTAQPSLPPPTYTEKLLYMKSGRRPDSLAATELRGTIPQVLDPYGAKTMLGEQIYNFTELAGLKGFMTQTMSEMMFGTEHPYDLQMRHSTPAEMWSTRRAFWDLNLGDVTNTEFFRRFVPREKKVWEKINPLRNKLSADWLPGTTQGAGDFYIDFLHSDPFTKIPEGEIRLPGQAYETLYDVRHSFPWRASSLGKPVGEIVRGMVGLEAPMEQEAEDIMEEGSEIHRQIQENLIAANVGVKSEAMTYDAKNDIVGHIDLIMRDFSEGSGMRPVEIKTVSAKRFAQLNKGPFLNHRAQLNFYIKNLQAGNVGTLLYVNRDDPEQIKTFDVRYSDSLFRKDMQNVQKARQIAAGIIADGKGYSSGTSYSWLDRFRILADIAPTSKEYDQARKIVNTQRKVGLLSETQIEQVRKINQHRMAVLQKYQFYPDRFRGKVFNPDVTYQTVVDNENIKAAAEYSTAERAVGSLWERFLHMNTPIHTKLWNYRTPLEHYQRTRLYGSENSFWSRPYRDLTAPMYRQAFAADNPFDAAASFGWIGLVGFPFGVGSPLAALGGAAAGMAYGAARWAIGGDAWVPEAVERKRAIDKTFDTLKYYKAMDNFQLSGNTKYLTEAQHTMYNLRLKGFNTHGGEILQSMYYAEKPYMKAFMKETDREEQRKIIQSVPKDVASVLRKQWKMKDDKYSSNLAYGDGASDAYFDNFSRTGWEGFGEGEELEDIKIKTIQNEGFVAQDFGLGWYDDQRRMARSPFKAAPIDIDDPEMTYNPSNVDISTLRRTLEASLKGVTWRPLVYMGYTPGGSNSVHIQLNITRDRMRELSETIRGY